MTRYTITKNGTMIQDAEGYWRKNSEVVKLVKKARRMGLRPVQDADTREWLDGYKAACKDILADLTKMRGKGGT